MRLWLIENMKSLLTKVDQKRVVFNIVLNTKSSFNSNCYAGCTWFHCLNLIFDVDLGKRNEVMFNGKQKVHTYTSGSENDLVENSLYKP